MKNFIVIALVVLNFLIWSNVAQADVQTPAEIVKAELDAGNFGKRIGNTTLVEVRVTGDNEVTYINDFAGRVLAYSNDFEPSVVNAIENSPQDMENVLGGVNYRFVFTGKFGSVIEFTISKL